MFDAITSVKLAMEVDQLKLQSISHNIANMNTPGFKKQLVDRNGFEPLLYSNTQDVMQLIQNAQISTQGTLNQTHNRRDMALSGEGYFQVQNEHGIFYTRRGDFQINNHGELMTPTGDLVLGRGGPIKIDDAHFTVDAQGRLFIDNNQVGEITIVTFNATQSLNYVGQGLYQTEEAPQPADPNTRVLQGFIEQANVKSVDEMMDMVKISRHFETSQRVMRTADNLLATAINQLGEGNV